MARARTMTWDPANHLESDEDMVGYLQAALEENDAALVAAVLGDIAKARGMCAVARDTGLGRESLYKALSLHGNPELATVLKVLGSLGIELHASRAGMPSGVRTQHSRRPAGHVPRPPSDR